MNLGKLSTESYSNGARRNHFKESEGTAQFNYQIKEIIRLSGLILANGAISVLYASKRQRLQWTTQPQQLKPSWEDGRRLPSLHALVKSLRTHRDYVILVLRHSTKVPTLYFHTSDFLGRPENGPGMMVKENNGNYTLPACQDEDGAKNE